MARRRAPNKGKCCKRYKMVKVKGSSKKQRRCASFGAKASGGYRKKKRKGTRKGAKRKTARGAYKGIKPGMARKGSKCKRYKRVRVLGGGICSRRSHI